MTNIKVFIQKNWYPVCIIVVLIISTILRFITYENRWGLAYDQAHDVLVAKYALQEGKLPLLGPFSSAGPFQTGGEWYWFIMGGILLNPNVLLTPWIVLTIVYVLFVFVIIKIGTELVDKKFGILVGLLAAVSTAQLAQGTNLTNQSPLAITTLFALGSMIQFVRSKNLLYAFFLGFFVSLSASFHLQGVSLGALVLATLLFGKVLSIKGVFVLMLGLVIPTLPILIFDIQNNFLNIRGLIQYYLFDQYKVSLDVLGRRWLTYSFIFWPKAWGHIVGGFPWSGYLLMAIVAIVVLYKFIKREITREWNIIILSFLGIISLIRYVRTPIFDSYLVFLHPYVLFLTAFGLYYLYKKNLFIGISITIFIIVISLIRDVDHIQKSEHFSGNEALYYTRLLTKNFPNEKFSMYSYKYGWMDKNATLSLFLYYKDLIDDNGRRIGIVVATRSGEFKSPVLQGDETGYQLLDLQGSSSGELKRHGFSRVNPRDIYIATQEWYTKN